MILRKIHSIDQPEVQIFGRLTESEVRRSGADGRGLLIAESPKVITRALEGGLRPVALLCEEKHIEGDARQIIARMDAMLDGGLTVYTGERDVLRQLTGYTLTRGVLCAMERPVPADWRQVCQDARRIAVLDGISDAVNVGSIFRSAAALGVDALLVTPATCDPYNRRAARVSMGNVFAIPWAHIDRIADLRSAGIRTAAFALTPDSVNLDDPALNAEPRLAMIFGEEGYGLAESVIGEADYVVCIPMSHGTDSLNVGVCAALAFWQLRPL